MTFQLDPELRAAIETACSQAELSMDTVESLFGSDDSIGIRMCLTQCCGDEEIISSAEYSKRYGHLSRNDQPDAHSIMPDDSSATCCTNYANHVRSVLEAMSYEVEVVGFANEDNPSSLCAKEEFHPGGHDFAIVNQRYLVDPWVRLVACVEDQIFYDLSDKVDAGKALEIYGPRHCWLPLSINSNDHSSPMKILRI